MARLIYSAISSLDGYVADADGRWDWSMPSEEVHAFVNDRMRSARTHLYGRRMYEVLVAWETMDDPDPIMRDYAEIWRGAEKIVYSSTLEQVSSARTRIEPRFDPEAVRELKAAAGRDLAIGGPTLAAEAFAAGLIDRVHLLLSPVSVGGGTPVLPRGTRIDLELVDERRFDNGAVHLGYRVQS
jgi:dihydrofolate reductase